MSKYRDTRSLGKSDIVPFIPDEGPKERHTRRLTTNLAARQGLITWCAEKSVALSINNEGHHWKLSKDKVVAEWWPSSAKLVINNKYDRGIHAHDWLQVVAYLEREKVFD